MRLRPKDTIDGVEHSPSEEQVTPAAITAAAILNFEVWVWREIPGLPSQNSDFVQLKPSHKSRILTTA